MATQIKKVNPMSRMTRKELYEKCKLQQDEIQKLNLFQDDDKNENIGLKYEKLQILNNEVWAECKARGDEIDKLNALLLKRSLKAVKMNENFKEYAEEVQNVLTSNHLLLTELNKKNNDWDPVIQD